MKQKLIFTIFLIVVLLVLAACNTAKGPEPATEVTEQNETISGPTSEEPVTEKISVENCAEAEPGTHQLIYAAQGICFLYPENYDVFQGEDGSLTLYVKSLLNTEAPLADIHIKTLNGRSIQEVIPGYPSDAELATMSLLTIDLGGEMATVLDNLPGQDTNRRIIAIHGDKVYDLMIARIGEDYGAVGEEAEALYDLITSSWQFIGIEPEAPLLAGPECPEVPAGITLFTNDLDGFCVLLPDGYEAEIGDEQTAVYVDSLQDVTHARLFINVEEANGRSLDDVTKEKTAEVEAILGEAPMWSFGYMLDGVPANQFDQVPGQDLSRQVVLVHNGRLYTLTFTPDDPGAGDAYAEMQTLYDLVMDSFSFLRQS
jgi:hypothetical protein